LAPPAAGALGAELVVVAAFGAVVGAPPPVAGEADPPQAATTKIASAATATSFGEFKRSPLEGIGGVAADRWMTQRRRAKSVAGAYAIPAQRRWRPSLHLVPARAAAVSVRYHPSLYSHALAAPSGRSRLEERSHG
ncbi:MAG TPA: hypothetical protein VIM30_15685, partial [Candidatus Limnocylindrales bacterium]